jgi:lipopolysaccharide export system ATP-binding protein
MTNSLLNYLLVKKLFELVPVFLPKSSNTLTSTINTQDLVKIYRNRTVVNHVSVNVKQGEIVGLLGPNGAGKTTTFYMVVGLIKPEEGRVFLDDQEITRLPMYKRARKGIGYLPQEPSVFRKLSVEDNIRSVLEMTKLTRGEQRHKLEALLDEFRLHHVRKNNGDSLSGGERRRTEIARALAVDPKFILLDEPFAGVDPIAVEDIQAVVARLKFKNIGILITDHNVNETLSICDRAYLLIDGKIFQHGTAEELAENEQVRRLYLGRNFELKRKDWLLDQGRTDVSVAHQRLVGYIQWMIDNIDNIISGQHKGTDKMTAEKLTDETNFAEFLNSYNKVIESIEAYAVEKKVEKLYEYTSQLRAIHIEQPAPDIAQLSTSTSGESLPEQMGAAKALLEKCRLIVDNPEFVNVLS